LQLRSPALLGFWHNKKLKKQTGFQFSIKKLFTPTKPNFAANKGVNASFLKKYLSNTCSRLHVTGFAPYLCNASYLHSQHNLFISLLRFSPVLDSDNLRY
jgi:hypothetical protein